MGSEISRKAKTNTQSKDCSHLIGDTGRCQDDGKVVGFVLYNFGITEVSLKQKCDIDVMND